MFWGEQPPFTPSPGVGGGPFFDLASWMLSASVPSSPRAGLKQRRFLRWLLNQRHLSCRLFLTPKTQCSLQANILASLLGQWRFNFRPPMASFWGTSRGLSPPPPESVPKARSDSPKARQRDRNAQAQGRFQRMV